MRSGLLFFPKCASSVCPLPPLEGFGGAEAVPVPGRFVPLFIATGTIGATIGVGTALGSTGAAGRDVLLVVVEVCTRMKTTKFPVAHASTSKRVSKNEIERGERRVNHTNRGHAHTVNSGGGAGSHRPRWSFTGLPSHLNHTLTVGETLLHIWCPCVN